MGDEDVSFPRGGRLKRGNGETNNGNKHLVFDHVSKKKRRSKKKQLERHHAVTGPQPKILSIEDLSYKVMTEGMLVLGIVKEIHDHFLDVILPGLTEGRVPITHISEPYTQLLKSNSQRSESDEELHPLSDMFYKGQLVTAQISNILRSEYGKHEISLSLNPSTLHSEWSHTAMAQKGLIITAAVRSIEEHGYVMDCGVKSLRCFLSKRDSTTYCDTFHGGQSLVVGQLLRCLVSEAEPNVAASKICVTIDPAAIAKKEKAASLTVTMQQLIPGMCFELAVLQELKGGIKAKIINLQGIDGFVHRNHFPAKFVGNNDSDLDVIPGSKHLGRLLYVTPMIKTPYFSLLPSVTKAGKEIGKHASGASLFPVGSIIGQAEICEVGGKGIILHLKKNKCHAKAFVPLRRSGFNFKRAEEENSKSSLDLVRNQFPIGTSVKCRVLHYDPLSNVFICSMEKQVLEEKYLTLSDISVGDVVPCIVEDFKNDGIVVHVGKVKGFVPTSHSADIPLQFLEQKYPCGLKVKGRVLKIDHFKHRMIITFKQSLISCDSIITSYSDAKKGHSYLGTVVAVTSKAVIVSFFGGVRGILAFSSSTVPEGKKFFEGQLVNCFVINCNDTQIHLSLFPRPPSRQDVKPSTELNEKPENPSDEPGVNVGDQVSLEVVSIDKSGLHVKIVSGNFMNEKGLIPTLHLCDDIRLAPLLLKTYEIGKKLDDVWCYRSACDNCSAIFSLRPSVMRFFQSVPGQILRKKSFEAVSEGWIIPCSVGEIHSDHLLLEVPLPQFSKLVHVDIRNISNNKGKLGLIEGQGIFGKILDISYKKGLITLGCSLKHVWDGEVESCTSYLLDYLKDQQRLLEHAKEVEDPLGSFRSGADVDGVIKQKTEWGFVVDLKDGVRGEVTFFNASRMNLEIGDHISGKVLFVDCLRQHVEISMLPFICGPTHKNLLDSTSEKMKPPVRLRGPTVLVTPEFTLVQVKWIGERFLAFIPTLMYPQMSSPLMISEPYFGLDRKLICKSVSGEFIVCLPLEVVTSLKKAEKKKLKQLAKCERRQSNATDFNNDLLTAEEIKQEEDSSDSEVDNDETSSDDIEADNIDSSAKSPIYKRKIDHTDQDCLSKRIRRSSSDSVSEVQEPNEVHVIENLSTRIRECGSSNTMEVNSDVICLDNGNQEPFTTKIGNNRLGEAKRSGNSDIGSPGDVKKSTISKTSGLSVEGTSCNNQNNPPKDSSNLKLKSPGFVWNVDPKNFLEVISADNGEASSGHEEEDPIDQSSKKSNRKKSASERKDAAKLEEERLQKIELDLMDPKRQPSSCDDFDKLVLSNPNDSSVWLQYMAFHMQATEIEKARSVAQRALKTINYREEGEKLNIWLGLLNLESLYGTPDTLSSILQEALQYNDPYKVRIHMIQIYAESGKCNELDSEVRQVTKKFKDTPGMWLDICSILMQNKQADRARKIFDMSLPFLKSKQESTALAVQFALLEARQNNLERAKALLESLLASYPQRVDVWCTYCDLLVKANNIAEARQLLERCTKLKLPARKMKTLFAKYLKFEESHGSPEDQDRVRSMAVEYVNQVTGETD